MSDEQRGAYTSAPPVLITGGGPSQVTMVNGHGPAPQPPEYGSIDLDDLAEGRRTIQVAVKRAGMPDVTFPITYDPRQVTPGFVNMREPDLLESARAVCRVVVAWPLRDQGVPVPLTVAAVAGGRQEDGTERRGVPIPTLQAILAAVMTDISNPQ